MNIENLEPVMKKYLQALEVIKENTLAVKPVKDEMTVMKGQLLTTIHTQYPNSVAIFIDGVYIVKEKGGITLKQITDPLLIEICTSYTGNGSFETHFEHCLTQVECMPKLSVKTCRPKNCVIVHDRFEGAADYIGALDKIATLTKPVDHVKKAKGKIMNIILEFLIVHNLDVVHLGSDYFLKETRVSKPKPTMARAAAHVWPSCASDINNFPVLWRAAMQGDVSEESFVLKYVKDKLPPKYKDLLVK